MTTCFVQLGRYGDIINILPAAYSKHHPGEVQVAVTPEFADLLEGVSYVTPRIWRGHYMDATRALADLTAEDPETVYRVTRLEHQPAKPRSSYCLDAWCALHGEESWRQWPLVFDRRDADRERALAEELLTPGDDRPILLMTFSAVSSPLAAADDLTHVIRERWRDDFQIVDLTHVRAHRLYDLLGLYERALAGGGLLVAADSAPLHLAWATPRLPVIALVADGWVGTAARTNWWQRVTYSQIGRHLPYIHTTIRGRLAQARHGVIEEVRA